MAEIGPVTVSGWPAGLAALADLAPVDDEAGAGWLALDTNGVISRWDVTAGTYTAVAATSVPAEPGHLTWCGRELQRRLQVSGSGRYAAVVNDYGRFGEVIELRTGQVTMALDNGGGHDETVPFSLAFARHKGREVVIHRTGWNRLDVSDLATVQILTAREPTSYRSGESCPDHYLDYFHGALYVSPDGSRVYDDGWFWQPMGMPVTWELAPWLDTNPRLRPHQYCASPRRPGRFRRCGTRAPGPGPDRSPDSGPPITTQPPASYWKSARLDCAATATSCADRAPRVPRVGARGRQHAPGCVSCMRALSSACAFDSG
jgi:hypothetical protein